MGTEGGRGAPAPQARAPGREAGLALARALLAGYEASDASWHYEHGLFLGAAREAGDAWGDETLSRRSRGIVSSLVAADGTIRGYRADEYNLDMINSGRNVLALYAETGEPRLRAAVELLASQLRAQPRTPSGGLWHKLIYPNQMWLDGLYMAQPFAARYAAAFGDETLLADCVAQFALIAGKARDPRTGLLRHAWDERRSQLWADPETGRSLHSWGRAVGWFAMALVDVIEVLPAGHAGRGSLGAILSELADASAEFRDPSTGLWHQVLDQGNRPGNYLEASVSSMLPYAFLKGVRLGLLDGSSFAPIACRAYEACCERFLRVGESGSPVLEGTCAVAGLGGSPYRDGSFEYYAGEAARPNDFKGVGPFILASVEYDRRGSLPR